MCLIRSEPVKIATKDIVCYKEVLKRDNGMYESLFYCFYYRKNQTYYLDETIVREFNGKIQYGFHSWKKKPNKYRMPHKGAVYVRFIIPKGAEYYEGIQYDSEPGYVSNMIRIADMGVLDHLTDFIKSIFGKK